MKNFFLIPDRYAHYREEVFCLFGKELIQKGYKPYLLIDTRDFLKTGIPSGDIDKIEKIFTIINLRNIYYKNIVIFQFNLIKNAFKYKPDILIAWGESHRLSTFLLLILCNLFKKKLVLWSHGFYGNENLLKLYWRKVFYSLSPLILLYGTRGETLMRKVLPRKKTFVIGNSTKLNNYTINFDNYKDIIKSRTKLMNQYSLKFKKDTILLSFIGRLTNLKKLEEILHIINFNKEKNFNFWIIGDGPEKKFLIKKCLDLDITNRVHFFGGIYSQKEIFSILSVSDVFICPSQLGLSAATALNAGLDILTCNSFENHMPETDILIKNNNITLTNFKDLNLTCKIINKLYKKNSKDINKRKKNQSLCYEYFSYKKHVQRIMYILNDQINF